MDKNHSYWKICRTKVNGRLAMMGSSNRHNQLRSIRMDSTRHLLKKMKFNSQFTINYKEEKLMTPEAERFNGWAAMLGFVAAVGAYATTGNIIPGIF